MNMRETLILKALAFKQLQEGSGHGDLVDALRQLGCSIDYLGQDGYPPLRIAQAEGLPALALNAPIHIERGYFLCRPAGRAPSEPLRPRV